MLRFSPKLVLENGQNGQIDNDQMINDSQIAHHNPCFNFLVLYNNSFDNQGSKINKNDIFLRFDMLTDDKYQQEINELKVEIKLLKQCDPKIEMYRNNTNSESKNENTASVSHGGQQENVELITIINFIEQTMKTLSSYGEQSKTQLDFNLTQQDK